MINLDRLLGDLEELSGIGRLPSGGLTRQAFSPAELEARAWFQAKARAAGLAVRVDQAGNIFGRLGGAGPAVLTGSHLDTIEAGGAYDGALGVLAGLECLRTMQERGIGLDHPVEVVAFSDEEERFLGFLGSLALTGRLGPADLDRAADESGLPLTQAMTRAGLDPARIREAARPAAEIKAFVELHVEQGPILDRAGVSVGLVDLVKGNYRFGLTLTGRRDHAGSPMAGRRDPMLPAVAIITRIKDRFDGLSDDQALMTVGLLKADPGIENVIPGSVYFTVDFRAVQAELLPHLEGELERAAAGEAAAAGVGLVIRPLLKIDPVRFDRGILGVAAEAAREAGVEYLTLPSGAGHDAQVMGQYVPSAMIFAPSRAGRSHCPEEETSPGDVGLCAEVLLRTLIRLARKFYEDRQKVKMKNK